jgi:peptidoglycan-N-acetylglucosamine deacetylase
MGYVVPVTAAIAALTGGAAAAWAARGRSSTLFAPSVWRGPSSSRRAIALTFDDGPSESTEAILELLARFRARATFFQCGVNAERLPAAARAVSEAGHEIGNHTHTHPHLWLRSAAFIEGEVSRAQSALTAIHGPGAAPRYFRAPYGVRWPGLAASQNHHGLLGVMWTTIAGDWGAAAGGDVAARIERGLAPGTIICLHDGRELTARPDISNTIAALERTLPQMTDRGFELVTVTELLAKR